MKKRALSILLAAAVLIGLVSVTAPQVSAASAMKVSEAGIALIKQFEGFSEYPYYDYGQWSVGYGSGCNQGDYPDGITEAEADALLRKYVASFETSLNKFIAKYDLTLNQSQYDALLSFTYNLGSSWMNDPDMVFTDAVISGATGNDFIFAITRWCTVVKNGTNCIETGLVKRRLIEANVYLNGTYSKSVPSNYKYLIFSNNITGCVNDVRIQGYDNTKTDGIRATPSKSGYRFLGWYTKAEGGEWITSVGPDTAVTTVYGHWQQGSGAVDAEGNVTGSAADYQRYAAANAVVRATPSTSGAQVDTLDANETVTIVADYMDAGNVKWGKLSTGGWVNLADTATQKFDLSEAIDPVTVHVLSSGVNIRSGPGTNYSKQGTFTKGQELVITAVQKGGQYTWGKSATGWICLDYTDYDLVTAGSSGDATKVTATGVVINTDKLNVRSGPGTSYAAVGSLSRGARVKITLQQKVGSTTWGLTEAGWISLYYVQVTPVSEEDSSEETETPGAAEEPDTSQNTVIATGQVTDCGSLRIRAGAGTDYECVGSLTGGTKVEIYEKTTVSGQSWGRISKGWICLSYVQLDGETGSNSSSATTGSSSTSVKMTGVVVNTDTLRIRSGAGVSNAQVGTLTRGTKVEILETTKVGSVTWGRISKGWISLYYVQLESQTSGVKTVTATSLNIRSGAGTNYAWVGSYKQGAQVTILEQKTVSGRPWGRTNKGWICLDYCI